jgi:catalase (peroxidase I)
MFSSFARAAGAALRAAPASRLVLGGVVFSASAAGMMTTAEPWWGGSKAADSVDLDALRKDIEAILDEDDNRGPTLVRLGWHASGTYDKTTGTGGSFGGTMRFDPELGDGANAGLDVAQGWIEPLAKKYSGLSHGDLWTYAAKVAIEYMGGPEIRWRSGRQDASSAKACPPNGRLPDASLGWDHVRDVFGRMGFNDRETVALIGAHTLGRCHTNASGYTGPWTRAPTTWSNLYFQELVNNTWTPKKWGGPLQFEDPTGDLMMLPADMTLLWDPAFSKIVKEYAKDEEAFNRDFAAAFAKLMELGCKF